MTQPNDRIVSPHETLRQRVRDLGFRQVWHDDKREHWELGMLSTVMLPTDPQVRDYRQQCGGIERQIAILESHCVRVPAHTTPRPSQATPVIAHA